MVIKMKHITLIGPYLNKEKVLEELQKLGVVDIIEKKLESIPQIKEVMILDKIHKSINILSKYEEMKDLTEKTQSKESLQEDIKDDAESLCDKIINYENRIDVLTNNIVSLEKGISTQLLWGNFDYKDIKKFKDDGILYIQFWSTTNINKIDFKKGQHPIIVNKTKKGTYFITLSIKPYEAIPNCTETLFSHSIKDLKDGLQTSKNEVKKVKITLNQLNQKYKNKLESDKVEYIDKSEYQKAKLNMDEKIDGNIYVLYGWCPVQELDNLESVISNYSVHLLIDDPTKKDNIPVQIKNGPFTKLFEPITKLFMLPDYFELDLTAFFAPMFWFFFGLCLGDAGWGAVILIAGIIGTIIMKKPAARKIMILGIFLGVSTIAVGLLTGSMMGFDTRVIPILKDIVLFQNINIQSTYLFKFAIIIGMFQINIGMIVKTINTIKNKDFSSGLYPIGNMLLVDALFLGIILPQVDVVVPIPDIIITIATFTGLALILLFNSKGFIFKRIGLGVYELYNVITGFFGDMLSYLRLFALGLAGSILGQVINQIGAGFLDIPVQGLNYVIYILFLVMFHGLMLVLNALGAFVHPLRLTFVEFYNNAGFKGTLNKYKPFSLERKVEKAV